LPRCFRCVCSGSLLPFVQALSLGVPVVTLPSARLGGRLVLALYRQLRYGFGGDSGADEADEDEEEKEEKTGEAGAAAGEQKDATSGGSGGSADDNRPFVTIQSASDAAATAAGLAPTPPRAASLGPTSPSPPSTSPPSTPLPRLVVGSASEYAATAMAIAHSPALRYRLARALFSRLPALLDNPLHADRAVADWRRFLFGAVAKAAREGRTRTMTAVARGASPGAGAGGVKAAPRFPPAAAVAADEGEEEEEDGGYDDFDVDDEALGL